MPLTWQRVVMDLDKQRTSKPAVKTCTIMQQLAPAVKFFFFQASRDDDQVINRPRRKFVPAKCFHLTGVTLVTHLLATLLGSVFNL